MKQLLFYTILFFSCASVYGKQVMSIAPLNPIWDQTTCTAPIREIENLEDGIIVSYTFKYMNLDSLANNKFLISFEDCGMLSIPGLPSLPIKMDAFRFGKHQSIQVSLVDYSYLEYPLEIATTPDFAIDSEFEHSQSTETSHNDSEVNIPQNTLSHQIQSYKDVNICYVNIMPIEYNQEHKTIKIATNLKYQINFTPKTDNFNSETALIDPMLSNIILNNDLESIRPQSLVSAFSENKTENYLIDTPHDYLIISTPKFESSIKYFSEWKKTLGFQTHIILNDKWESSSSVRDSIYKYHQMYPNLNYLLIVGDANEVPADSKLRYNSTDVYHLTDYYYGCISQDSEFKYIPDIHRGRIPATTNDEAQIAFEKIVAYEVCEDYPSDFFESSLHIAYFMNNNQDGYDTSRFILTSEEILNTMRENGTNPNRVYICRPKGNPKYYANDRRYESYGQPLPDELLSQDFNWTGGKNEIATTLKAGVNYVLYRGHGGTNLWSDCFNSSDIKDSHRKDTPALSILGIPEVIQPIIYSICCDTGKYNSANNLSSSFLFNSNSGGSAVIASSDWSYSGPNDAFALGMFDATSILPLETSYIKARESSSAYKPILRLGQVMDQGLYRMAEKFNDYTIWNKGIVSSLTPHQYEIFHCFGDPSMLVRTGKPSSFSNASVTFDEDTRFCTVSTGEGHAIISFYDRIADKVESYFAETATFQFSRVPSSVNSSNRGLIKDQNVTICAPNKTPYLVNWFSVLNDFYNTRFKVELQNENYLSINYDILSSDNQISVVITRVSDGANVMNISCPLDKTEISVDISNLSPGLYIVSIKENDIIQSSITIQKN